MIMTAYSRQRFRMQLPKAVNRARGRTRLGNGCKQIRGKPEPFQQGVIPAARQDIESVGSGRQRGIGLPHARQFPQHIFRNAQPIGLLQPNGIFQRKNFEQAVFAVPGKARLQEAILHHRQKTLPQGWFHGKTGVNARPV